MDIGISNNKPIHLQIDEYLVNISLTKIDGDFVFRTKCESEGW